MSSSGMTQIIKHAVEGNYEEFSKALSSEMTNRLERHPAKVQYAEDLEVITKQRAAFSQVTGQE